MGNDCTLGPWSEWKYQRHFACVAWFTRSRHCVKHKYGANCKLEKCYTTTPDGRPSIPKMQEGRYENQTDCSGEPGPTWTPPSTWTPMPPSETTWTTMPPSETTWTTMPPSETTWTDSTPSTTSSWSPSTESTTSWSSTTSSKTTLTSSTASSTWSSTP